MNRFKKIFAPLVVLILALLAIGGAVAFAQSRDTWSGHRERVVTSTIPVTASSTAQIVTAVEARRLVVKSLVLHASAAGLYSFHDGSGGANLGSFYLEQNVPFVVRERDLGHAIRTTAGTALHASGTASANLTITARVQEQY